MPINLLGGGEKKQETRELRPEAEEKIPQKIEMTSPGEDTLVEEKGGGISAFLKKKQEKTEQKQQEQKKQDKPETEQVKQGQKKETSLLQKQEKGAEQSAEPGPPNEKAGLPAGEKGAFDISLMPSRLMVIPRTVRSSFFLFIAALIVVITILGLVWLYTDWHFEKIAFRIHEVQGDMQLLEVESTFYLETRNEIAVLEAKAARVDSILNNHIYWTKFFTLLESYTIPDVYFGDFSADVSDAIHLDVVAKDLISLAKQLVSFKQAEDFVQYAAVSGIRKIPDGIAAVFDLTLVDDVFRK